jgi:protein O-GlcNAc transferase
LINYSISWISHGSDQASSKLRDPVLEGIAAHRAGHLERAYSHYESAIGSRPNRALAYYNLGLIFIDAGLGMTSMPFFLRAVMLEPSSVRFCYALFFGLLRSARLEEARRFLADAERNALSQETLSIWRRWLTECETGHDPAALGMSMPGLTDVSLESPDHELGLPVTSPMHAASRAAFEQALHTYRQGRMRDLVDQLDRFIERQPAWGEACHLRGLGLMALEDFAHARESLERASELIPGVADVWDHLGVARSRTGDDLAARQAFERALALNPWNGTCWYNAAQSALDHGRLEEAFQYGLRAVLLAPELRQASSCLLRSAYQLEEARAQAAGRYENDPNGPLTLAVNAARATVDSPEQAVALAPMFAEIGHYQQAIEVLEQSVSRFGDTFPGLLGQLVFNQRYLCDWRHWHERQSTLIDHIRCSDESVVTPFSALSIMGLTPADQLKIARAYGKRYPSIRPPLSTRDVKGSAATDQRLRIGYLSADFQQHATAYLTAAFFERHDRTRFEVFAYSSRPDDGGSMRQRLRGAIEHFVEIQSLSDQEVAQRIYDDEIDILVDLKGYTRHNRLGILAWRPAPVQVSWLAFPGTLGLPFIDYLVVDPILVPPEAGAHYDETLAYLPDAYAPVDDRRQVAPIPTRAEVGLPEHGFVFCCFNDPYKITPEVFERWCRLLENRPDSVLWLYARSHEVIGNLTREAAARGVASERLVFAGLMPQPEHLARLALADLFLDTLPCNAHTTASDALWMGVPILTCQGETFAARVASSLVTAAGLPELITRDLDEYEARALSLSSHPEELGMLKARLTMGRTHAAFFDTERFTRNLEALFGRIWERHLAGLPPVRLDP